MVRPITRYEDSDEEEGQGDKDKENNANSSNANTAGETVEEAMEKMFEEEEKKEEETKEKDDDDDDGGGDKVFPIFRRSSVRTGLRGSPAKLASTPNKGWIQQSSLSDSYGRSFITFDRIFH